MTDIAICVHDVEPAGRTADKHNNRRIGHDFESARLAFDYSEIHSSPGCPCRAEKSPACIGRVL